MNSLSTSHAKTRAISLLIEHAPCCLLSLVAGWIGIAALSHNTGLELGFAIGGALLGEYLGHRFFHADTAPADDACSPATDHSHCHGHQPCAASTLRRYGLALTIGLLTWGLHQVIFH